MKFCLVVNEFGNFTDSLSDAKDLDGAFELVCSTGDDSWRHLVVQKMWIERRKMSQTPLVSFHLPGMPEVDLYFKDESQSITGSLKHRVAWSLFMWGLLEDHVRPNRTIYEASSGNSAIAQAYFAQVIGVPYVAVVPDYTEETKTKHIEQYGAKVVRANIATRFKLAEELARKKDGFYMNQWANAGEAEESHESGNFDLQSSNVLHEIISQLKNYPHYFIHTSGTGGTLSSVGKYVKRYNIPTQVVLADTEFSIYCDYVLYGKFKNESGARFWKPPGLHGFGFGYCCPAIYGETMSLKADVIDRAVKIPDLASVAAMHFLKKHGIYGGTSKGINFLTSLSLAAKERKLYTHDKKLSIVTLIGDNGSLYESTYFDEKWISENFEDPKSLEIMKCWKEVIENAYLTGNDPMELGQEMCMAKHEVNRYPDKLDIFSIKL